MDWDWMALGSALRARRAVLGLSREEAAKRAGISAASIKNYELATKGYAKIPRSIVSYAEVLGWTRRSLQVVLEGGKPELVAPEPAGTEPSLQGIPGMPAPLPPLGDRLPLRVRLELENGEIADYDQYDLTVGDGARIITFLRIDPATPGQPRDPEELRRIWREWEQFKRRQRGLKPLPWEPGDPEEWKAYSEG